MSNSLTLHGVFLEILGLGVLLTGNSGIGKSELALSLIDRGHRLIADDSVLFEKTEKNHLIGSCPDVLQDFLEVRGLGVINVRVMYGDPAIADAKRLNLIVQICKMSEQEIHNIDRLHGIHRDFEILGVKIPETTLPVAAGRNLSILVEGAVRQSMLRSTGYHASDEFIDKQRQALDSQ